MAACFIVLAHRSPQQLARLVSRLAPHHVLVHVDARVSSEQFSLFQQSLEPHPNASLIRRFRSSWASWGAVEAVLEGLRVALQQPGWTHVMHVTGQDYPLLSSSEIEAYFNNSIGSSFIHHWSMPHPIWGQDGGMFRLRYWHMPLFKRRLFVPIPRKLPEGIRFFGSSAYWCLTPEATIDLLEFVKRRPDIVRFYRRAWMSDEQFIATAVLNGTQGSMVRNQSLTYIRWAKEHSPHPVDLTITEGQSLLDASFSRGENRVVSQPKLFARKLDLARAPDLFDFIDRSIAERSTSSRAREIS